jgi:hypothetical protein
LALLASVNASRARDLGQWEGVDPEVSAWYKSLRQPDEPSMSCCGESDAYWADQYEVDKDGNTVAIITDTRDDEPLNRPHVEPGTRIIVPPNKLKWDSGNPTGHIVIFLGYSHKVYCYVQNGGV